MLYILPRSLQTDTIFPTLTEHHKGLDGPNPDDTVAFQNLKKRKKSS